MLSLSQIQAGAYWDGESTIICVKCGDKKGLPISAQINRYTLESEFFDESGLYCDDCGEEILAPYIDEDDEEETELDENGDPFSDEDYEKEVGA